MARRKSKQPYDMPSAGSVFKRPQGYYAAALIEECGLKGRRVGGAQVSEKHAGFIVNTGGATCQDVLGLIAEIQAGGLCPKGRPAGDGSPGHRGSVRRGAAWNLSL